MLGDTAESDEVRMNLLTENIRQWYLMRLKRRFAKFNCLINDILHLKDNEDRLNRREVDFLFLLQNNSLKETKIKKDDDLEP